MIVCKIEMWPKGDEAQAFPLGQVRVTRDGGDAHIAHYTAELMKSVELAQRDGPWRSGRVLNFRRRMFGPYDLVLRGLIACIAGRSLAAVRQVPEDTLLFDSPRSFADVG